VLQGAVAVAQLLKEPHLFLGHDEKPVLAIILEPCDSWGADELEIGVHLEIATDEDIARNSGVVAFHSPPLGFRHMAVKGKYD
jgi:hypothetical protein